MDLQRYKVVVTGHSFRTLVPERLILEDIADVVETQPSNLTELIALAHDADGIMNQNSLITKQVISSLTRCKVIVAYGIGTDKIDLAAAAERGIQVCNVPNYCLEEVATHTIALLLSFERNVPHMMARLRDGHWEQPEPGSSRRLRGRTLGLIGFGRIAQKVAAIAASFGLEVRTYDPYIDRGIARAQGVEWVTWDELLRNSDYISIHVPLTRETYELINTEALAQIKPGAVLINTSRGKLVHEQALIASLTSGHLRGAALDVFFEEPLAADNPLLQLENVVATPHIAWYSDESEQQLKQEVAEEVRRVLCGEPPRYPVNSPVDRIGSTTGHTVDGKEQR